jgi:hypothetical protein
MDGEGCGPRAAGFAAHQDDVGLSFGDPRRNRADTHFAHQLDGDTRMRVGALEVVDELGKVFDGVDVVVGRRRNEPHIGRRVTGFGDPRVDFEAGQLSALPGLGPLGHLDLQISGAGQVRRRDPEAARSDLLDG